MAREHGESVAREVGRLPRDSSLAPLPTTIRAGLKQIELPFGPLPTRDQWEERAKKPGAEGYHARTNLARLDRGVAIPTTLPYVVQSWTFGDDLLMVFSRRRGRGRLRVGFKAECDGDRLWISALRVNDVPCYIASRRVIAEGGYEVDTSMLYFDRPTRLDPAAEDRIIAAVHELLPDSFRRPRSR